jgi:tetratricopeptide (TPR) repeat protein
MKKWLELAPGPRPRPPASGPFADSPIEWDVFVSYRSTNRHWAVALYDQLVEAKFRVFLDQFVLRPGLSLDDSLEEHLNRSGSGVLVLSKDVATSPWVKNELAKMEGLAEKRAGAKLPFNLVIARIDGAQLPFTQKRALYSDFSQGYEDGPRGAELVRLVFGLVGASMPEQAVRTLMGLDDQTNALLLDVAAAAERKDFGELVQLAQADQPLVRESPAVAIAAVQALISAGKREAALEVVRSARAHFPRSLRLAQFEGLALRRLRRTDEAQKVLAKLYVAGHRDPETVGIYAATWMERYRASQDRADLERSRALYQEAFTLSPQDEYVGINAASKSALLGEFDLARQLAEQVGKLVAEHADGADFYKSLTLAEALVLVGHYENAERIYRDTRARHHARSGDLETTINQLELLGPALKIPDAVMVKLLAALKP